MCALPLLALAFAAAPPSREPTGPVLLHNLDGGHKANKIRGAAFSRDGKRLVTVCGGGILNVWDVATGKVIATARTSEFRSVEFSRDGKTLVAAGADPTVHLFDAATAREIKTFDGHTGTAYVARFTPDGKRIVSCGSDTHARVWDIASGKEVRTLECGSSYALAVSPDGRYAVTDSDKFALRLWDLETGRLVREMAGHEGIIASLDFSRDGGTIVSACYAESIRLWETRTGKERLEITNAGKPRAVILAGDGRHIAAINYGSKTRFYDALGGKEIPSGKGEWQLDAVAISRDGRRVCGGISSRLRVWDVSAVTRRQKEEPMTAGVFDDHWKALGSQDAAAAYKAVVALSSPAAAKHFAARLAPPKPLDGEARKRAQKLIAQFQDGDEAKWRKASEKLAASGTAILPLLKEVMAKETDADAKLRIAVTIRRADVSGSQELRLLRAIEALERAGTEGAAKQLAELAKGGHGTSVAAEGKAALGRLK